MNTNFYLDLNHFARDTGWAHGFMSIYADWLGAVILAALLVAAWWRARSDPRPTPAVAIALWATAGAVCALVIAQPVSHLVAEARPYASLHHVEVLVPRSNDYGFPSDHATLAGAVIAGLWLTRRDRWLAVLATIVGLFLAFARVYVGAHYPGDVIAGLVLGAAVVVVLRPVGVAILRWVVTVVRHTPLRPLAVASAGRHAARPHRAQVGGVVESQWNALDSDSCP